MKLLMRGFGMFIGAVIPRILPLASRWLHKASINVPESSSVASGAVSDVIMVAALARNAASAALCGISAARCHATDVLLRLPRVLSSASSTTSDKSSLGRYCSAAAISIDSSGGAGRHIYIETRWNHGGGDPPAHRSVNGISVRRRVRRSSCSSCSSCSSFFNSCI